MPTPRTRQTPSPLLDDVGAERAHGGGGAQHVLAFEQAVDVGFADRDARRTSARGANRLVARHADDPGQRAGFGGLERPRRHASVSPTG